MSLLINGEEFLILKCDVERLKSENNLLKKVIESHQAVILELGKNLKTESQELQLLRDFIDREFYKGKKRKPVK